MGTSTLTPPSLRRFHQEPANGPLGEEERVRRKEQRKKICGLSATIIYEGIQKSPLPRRRIDQRIDEGWFFFNIDFIQLAFGPRVDTGVALALQADGSRAD